MTKYFSLIIPIIALASCSGGANNSDKNTPSSATLKQDVKQQYATLVCKTYEAALTDAKALQKAINSFASQPSELSFQQAKQAWLQARESYGITEAYRFANGPIDDEDGPEGLLNAWPLDEAYIDYVQGNESAGIINDLATYPTLDKALLESLNEQGGETNISIGYHAIEFLLWGQDLTKPADKQAGLRTFEDYTTKANAERRKTYLTICAELLVQHLESVTNEWRPSGENYRSTFLTSKDNDALTGILKAIAILSKSELAGERIFTALDNRDQEDEHSCFSDNTHTDIRLNLEGIRNVYLGSLDGSIHPSSIHNLVASINAEEATNTKKQLDAAINTIQATAIPFDFAISDDTERVKVQAAVTQLRALGEKIVDVGTALELNITTDLPN